MEGLGRWGRLAGLLEDLLRKGTPREITPIRADHRQVQVMDPP